jgi:hypothetical protein
MKSGAPSIGARRFFCLLKIVRLTEGPAAPRCWPMGCAARQAVSTTLECIIGPCISAQNTPVWIAATKWVELPTPTEEARWLSLMIRFTRALTVCTGPTASYTSAGNTAYRPQCSDCTQSFPNPGRRIYYRCIGNTRSA